MMLLLHWSTDSLLDGSYREDCTVGYSILGFPAAFGSSAASAGATA